MPNPSHVLAVADRFVGALTCGLVRPTTRASSPVPATVTARRRNVMPPWELVMPVTVYEVDVDGTSESIVIDGVQAWPLQ